MIKIVIIEDNEYMREGWSTVLDLEKDMCVIGSFDSCEKAFSSGELQKADLVLLDIELPGIHGTEGVKVIRSEYPDTLVLMVTIHDENEMIFKALRNGAHGYLLKKTSPDELIDSIHQAMDGGSPMSPLIARKVIRSFHENPDNQVELSDVEQQILQELSEGNSYKKISEHIHLSVDGVRYHIRKIYAKLEARNSSEAVAKGISLKLIK